MARFFLVLLAIQLLAGCTSSGGGPIENDGGILAMTIPVTGSPAAVALTLQTGEDIVLDGADENGDTDLTSVTINGKPAVYEVAKALKNQQTGKLAIMVVLSPGAAAADSQSLVVTVKLKETPVPAGGRTEPVVLSCEARGEDNGVLSTGTPAITITGLSGGTP